MKPTLIAIAIAATITFTVPIPVVAAQRVPSYLILRAPAKTHKERPYYPGRGYEVRTQTYAYGWFGARPRHHLRRSTGYNESYLQWSKR